jgi:AcrR family transcriptional regulator
MRNAEASRERILEAALAEFSAYGIAGARVDRIAAAAKCNKNLIYIYFDSKEKLFATVLKKNLAGVYDDVPFTPADLPDYAARAFDLVSARPELMRLVAWYSLEQTSAPLAERDATRDTKIEALAKAQKSKEVGNAFPPGFLLTSIMALATAWAKSSPFSALDPIGDKHPSALRKNIREAVRLLAMSKKS